MAWLVELDDNSARTQGDLCSRHAASLVLPRGWELRDEREGQAAADPESAATTRAPAAGSTRRARGRRKSGASPDAEASRLPGLESEPGVTTAEPERAEIDADGDEAPELAPDTAGRGVPAQFGTNEDSEVVDDQLDEILDARTPLLRRAFRNAKPT